MVINGIYAAGSFTKTKNAEDFRFEKISNRHPEIPKDKGFIFVKRITENCNIMGENEANQIREYLKNPIGIKQIVY